MKNFKNVIYLSLGSNRGDRVDNIRRAIDLLRQDENIEVIKISGFYETAALYLTEQADFINCAVALKTSLEPVELLAAGQAIEKRTGRKKGKRYGPRVIDLDILSYGPRVIDSPELRIPHPRMAERRFVLEPLREINPRWRHPVLNKTVTRLLKELGEEQRVTYSGPAPEPPASYSRLNNFKKY